MAQNLNPIPPDLFLWEEALPGGCHWSGVLRRGNALVTDLTAALNVRRCSTTPRKSSSATTC
jgi:hypothetical protein